MCLRRAQDLSVCFRRFCRGSLNCQKFFLAQGGPQEACKEHPGDPEMLHGSYMSDMPHTRLPMSAY